MKKITLLWAALLCVSLAFAQTSYVVQFQDEIIDIQENIDTFEWEDMPQQTRMNGGNLGWIQFYETPTQDIQDTFKVNGLQLIDYIPHRTYLFYFPTQPSRTFLKNNGVRAIIPVEGRFKLGQNLKNGTVGDWAIQGDNLLVTLQFHDQLVDINYVLQDLATHQIALKQQYAGANLVDLIIPNNCLENLSNLPYVKWVEQISAPPVKDDVRGRSLSRASGLETQTSTGRNYTGAGIGVMVRDDGAVGPHIDYEGRITNLIGNGGGTHGDGVGGIMAGAGNVNPEYRGTATGTDVYVVGYVPNHLDTNTVTLINNGDVQITNSSYSDGCNAGYTTTTRTVDTQIQNIPSLLHVYSGGNSNNNNCGYGAGSQWGNITGGHKQGKNVIATANVFYNGVLVNSSSRGPGHDGRIKPDITANGQGQISTAPNHGYLSFGGTSGAAPNIAGVAAQLYEMYQDIHGELPSSALIKAAMLNTANDYGNVGPDFRFGWGVVNALRAGMTLEDGRWLTDQATQGNSNTHTIDIPAGTAQVRFMLYWPDVPASPGANPALVNDLDLVVTDPSNNDLLPWILDHTPDPAALAAPATNGEDHLNNMEQVLINNPEAGSYELEVSGFNIPTGPQEYFIVYEVIEQELTLTYPNAEEHLAPGQSQTIHWDDVNTTENYDIEYSTDNGATWSPIVTNLSNAARNHDWTVPNEVTGQALVRITSGAFSDQSDKPFSIAPRASNLQLSQVCNTTATFTWNPVTDAESYDFYVLGEKYMEVVGTTTTNSITIEIDDPADEIWYSVAPKNSTAGWEGLRTNAERHTGGLSNCSNTDDLAMVSINNDPADFSSACTGTNATVSISIENNGSSSQSNFPVSYQLSGGSVVQETFTGTIGAGQRVDFDFSTAADLTSGNGEYTLTTNVGLSGDENNNNDQQDIVFYAQVTASAVPVEETFENEAVPTNGWSIVNPDDATTWAHSSNIVGADGNITNAAFMNNYSYDASGQEDWLVTEVVDLSTGSAFLGFDLAKAQTDGTRSDELRVEISTDCGGSWTSIFDKSGAALSTVADQATNWVPSEAADWRLEQVDLSSYLGGNVIFRFVNVNGFGNATFIDNVRVTTTLGQPDITATEIALFPNPANDQVMIQMAAPTAFPMDIVISNSLGQTVESFNEEIFNGTAQAQLNVSSLRSGLYFVSIRLGENTITKKLLIR